MYLYAFKLVATIWNNRINSYSDVFNRINFYCLYQPADKAKAELYAQLFLLRLYRWMKGEGHPQKLVGRILPKEINLERSSSPRTMRAKLFWKAVSDTVTLPASKTADVTVSTLQVVQLRGLKRKHQVRMRYMPQLIPSAFRPPLSVSACAKQMEIVLDPEVTNLLLEPGSMNDQNDTAFDLWIHASLATARDYNTL
jgi:hypothetical protein